MGLIPNNKVGQPRFYLDEFDNNERDSINYQVNRLLREAAALNSIIESSFSIINFWISIIKLKNSIIKEWQGGRGS
ncbi:hypothetical protein AS034_12800 [[Bacillus] enclensis]|nr:hypothetical protein AS034_12800 [[Bacillus] enclensis]